MKRFIFLFVMISYAVSTELPAQNARQEVMLKKINKLRSKGCVCQDRFMPPVAPLEWNSTLMTSALYHAEDMKEKDYFSHYSPTGKDIGDRIDEVGYSWSYCGENLGSGQRTFDEVMRDWIESKTHCMMLMNPEVEEVAVAKAGIYWVQHFGKRFDRNIVPSNK